MGWVEVQRLGALHHSYRPGRRNRRLAGVRKTMSTVSIKIDPQAGLVSTHSVVVVSAVGHDEGCCEESSE
jgi:hypothetical protein